jgi:hypothetical protein
MRDLTLTAMMVLVVAYLVTIVITTAVLKARHPTVWEMTGNFGLFANNSLQSGWKMMRFIFSDRYRLTGDRAVTLLVMILRVLFVASMVLFAINFAKSLRPDY